MKKSTITQAVLFLALLGTQASAAETFSPAYINQVSSAASFSRMSTVEIMKPAIEVAQRLAALRPDKSVDEIDTVETVTALYEGLQQGSELLVTAGARTVPPRTE